MNDTATYLLYASCIPVRGAKHKIICDLQRNGYVRIPDGLYEILTEHRGKSLADVKKAYKNEYDQIIDGYFDMLVKHEFAFPCTDPECFPELDLTWKVPFPVYNAILDRDHDSTYDLHDLIDQLSGLKCKFLQLRYFNTISRDDLVTMLNYFETIRSSTVGIEILAPSSAVLTEEMGRSLLKTYERLCKLTLHGSPGGFAIREVRSKRYLISMPGHINSETHCGVIDPGLFSVNIKAFTEAKKFNSCLNGKISVDRNGYIRNCPSMSESFGHVSETSLVEVSANPAFRAGWTITKDEVQVCRDCEFRYICTDCRAYTQGGKANGKPLKCGYDPYTGEWSAKRATGRSNTEAGFQPIPTSAAV